MQSTHSRCFRSSLGFEYESETDSNVNHLMDAGRMENLYYEAEDCRVYEPEKSMSIFEQIMKETTSNDEEVIWYGEL